jgi:CheY-like chemotaxis protein
VWVTRRAQQAAPKEAAEARAAVGIGRGTGLCSVALAIRVVLAEDNYLVREGIHRLLESEPEVDVVATCGDLQALLAAIESEEPDVALTDIRMPPTTSDEGIHIAHQLRDTHPGVGIVQLAREQRWLGGLGDPAVAPPANTADQLR